MTENKRTVTVTIIEKPARKLVAFRGKKATDYLELMAEIGCDKFELLAEIPVAGADENAVIAKLPSYLIKPDTSKVVVGLEVPSEYSGKLPVGAEIIDLSEFTYLCFQGLPYEDDDWYNEAYSEIGSAIENYNPALHGYEFAHNEAPSFTFGSSATKGTREMIPVKRLPTV